MSAYKDRAEEIEKYTFQMGAERGRLAMSLDLLTDALVLVGQHGVYCRSARRAGEPSMDIRMVTRQIADAKELILDVMEELKRR